MLEKAAAEGNLKKRKRKGVNPLSAKKKAKKPRPDERTPEPTADVDVAGEEGGAAEVRPNSDDWALRGLVYQDGSCAPHVIRELARASWAAVQVTAEGDLQAQIMQRRDRSATRGFDRIGHIYATGGGTCVCAP